MRLACFAICVAIATSAAVASPANQPPLLPGLPQPQALQGHDDENYPEYLAGRNDGIFERRYKVLGTMQPGIRRYNLFWSTFEVVPSQPAPFACPSGAVMTPATPAQLKVLGYNSFHCYSETNLKLFDKIFAADHTIGAQCGAILYSAPPFYRDPNCTGFIFGKDHIKGGCAPLDKHIPDFQDYVLTLAYRYSTVARNIRGSVQQSVHRPPESELGSDAVASVSSVCAGPLRHFVVWNEVASAGWMDMSPELPNRAGVNGSFPLTEAQFSVWVQKYADLVDATGAALHIAGCGRAALAWLSTDRLWERHPQKAGQPLHTGTRPFLDRLWPRLAASKHRGTYVFGTAVHPYGDAMSQAEFAPGFHPQAYTFATLDRVANYSRQKVEATFGYAPDSAAGKPYTLLYASEQGWPSPACCDDKIRSRNICYAQALSEGVSELIGVTHNYFHDNPGGSEQGGQDYGLIPGNVSADLSNGAGHPTFDAYVSTSPSQWAKSDAHFCCTQWTAGCLTKTSHGVFDPTLITTSIPAARVPPQPAAMAKASAAAAAAAAAAATPLASMAGSATLQLHGWAWDENAGHAGSDPIEVEIRITCWDTTTNHSSHVLNATVVAETQRWDIVRTWNQGSAPNADHGFVFTVPLLNISSACSSRNTSTKVELSVFAVSPQQQQHGLQLAESPRCLCNVASSPAECPC